MGMDVRTIVKLHVQRHGMDGLCNEDCGCGLDDFAPCGDGPYPDCEVARKLVKPENGDLVHPITNEVIHCPDADPGDDIYVSA